MDKENNEDINILLIDDDEDEYIIARDLFFEIGSCYKVHWINNFKQGLEEVVKNNYRICLLDYHLDIKNGVEFIKEAVLRACSIPIILLTGQGDHVIDLEAMKAGATDYLDKRKLDSNSLERIIRYTLERKKSEEKIRFLAYYDQLTHLPNRTLFFDRLRTAFSMAQRYDRLCAVMFLDIDNFKRINDTLGHNIGDLLIKEVGIRLHKCIRKEDTVSRDRFEFLLDTVARLGGDEFTILLSEIKEAENALRVAERIRMALHNPVLLDGNELSITVSIGIAIYPTDGKDIDTLIKNADIAMYSAKSRGKNNYQYYNKSMNSASLQKLNMEHELQNALKNNELSIYYQPIVDLKTREIKGAEALVYWQHPHRGIILPLEFIPVAEEAGLITMIGDFVFNTFGNHYIRWREIGLQELNISINISPRQLNQKDFLDTIVNWLNDFDISPRHMTFEITEHSIIHNPAEMNKIINAIRALGIKIAIDDFGSGYSSFITLKQITFDVLKIDHSFTMNIPDTLRDSTIVSSIISIGHSMNLQVLAEGIEREDQLLFLNSNGCDMGQGYYFSVPVTEDELVKIINR